MANTQLKIFGQEHDNDAGQHFYILVINPSWEVSQYVRNLKKAHQSLLGKSFGLVSKPHITLAGFPLYESQLGLFKRRVERICKGWNEIEVGVKDFQTFQNNGTIYLDVLANNSLDALYLNIAHFMRNELKIGAEFLPRVYRPHITVIRNLDRIDNKVYQQLWTEYRQREFSGAFTVKKLILLKYRPDGVGTDLIGEFRFGNDRKQQLFSFKPHNLN